MKAFYDDDTIVSDPEDAPASRHTIIGLPAPARLPAEPPGAKYRRLYPVLLDDPIEVMIRWEVASPSEREA